MSFFLMFVFWVGWLKGLGDFSVSQKIVFLGFLYLGLGDCRDRRLGLGNRLDNNNSMMLQLQFVSLVVKSSNHFDCLCDSDLVLQTVAVSKGWAVAHVQVSLG